MADDPRERCVHGICLAAYAGMKAGLTAGLALELVLENERVLAAAWSLAEDEWDEQLADSAAGDGALQYAFDAALLEASERYSRRIPPLDEDVQAWFDFLRHWSADPEPLALSARLGLRPGDLTRLHRMWAQRIAEEPALAARVQELLQKDPGELPVPSPQPVEMKPPAQRAQADAGPVQAPAEDAEAERPPMPALFTPLPHEPPLELNRTLDGVESPFAKRGPVLPFVQVSQADGAKDTR